MANDTSALTTTADASATNASPEAVTESTDPHEGPSPARSLLFLSCDLVGSTRFKQAKASELAKAKLAKLAGEAQQAEPEQPEAEQPDQENAQPEQPDPAWQMTFLSFYREFPQALGGLVAADATFKPAFNLWKAVGDELIFTVHVRNEDEIYRAVRLWLAAMDRYEKDSLSDTPLATKGGAFIATFPGPDSESSIPRNPATETSDKGPVELNDAALAVRGTPAGDAYYLYDYFGPSIDTGFRVIGACDNRYFTLSVEVAWAIAQCADDAGADKKKYPLDDLRLHDTREFKGVWDGRSYPLFALDRKSEDLINVALSDIQNTSVEPGKVVNLCQACAKDLNWPSMLYLPESANANFHEVPTDSLDAHRSNNMDGAETIPDEPAETVQELEENPPLPEPKAPGSRASAVGIAALRAAMEVLGPGL